MGHTITYRYGRDDYIAALRAQRSMSPLARFGRWGRYACFALLFVVLIDLINHEMFWNNPFVAFVVSGILFVIAMIVAPIGEFLAEQALARWILPRHSIANKDVTLEFGDDGVRSRYGGMQGSIPWPSINRVLDAEDHLFLSISRAEMMMVPKRALPSADAVAELQHYIRSKIGAAAANEDTQR
jgi:hypothetical protein